MCLRGDDINQDTFLMDEDESFWKVLEGTTKHKEEKSHVGSRKKHLETYK